MKVGPYELMHMLASSAESERWLARGPVGIAMVEVWTATDGAVRADLVAEAKAAMVLDNPGVARVIAAGESDSPPSAWVAIPADMAERLESVAPLPPSYAARVVHDAALALAYAHGAGRVHGALNGHLVLVGYDGVVRLTAFGAARVVTSERAKTGALTPGQAAFLSPEVLAGGKVTPASDVYTLGRLLAVAAGDAQSLPVALRAIHDQCTQAEPGSRLPSAAAFALAVSEAAVRELGAMPTSAELASYLRETLPTRREERARQWASATAGIPKTLTPVTFNIPRDPSNPGSSIPLFDASITTLFVRETSSADPPPPPDPLKQAEPIAGTWAALSTAFASPTPPVTRASLPPVPLIRVEEDRDDKTVQVVVAMLAIALIAFFAGALYLGPSAQADLSEADRGRRPPAVVIAPDLPVLSVSDPALWIVPGVPAPTPPPPEKPAPRGR